jgi:predicted Co/Zn/Cd cation transporter (cation efflux family)
MSSHQVLLNKLEKRALNFSVWGNVFMVIIGVGFAIVSASDAIMLDGLYSFIHLLIALLAMDVVFTQQDKWQHIATGETMMADVGDGLLKQEKP